MTEVISITHWSSIDIVSESETPIRVAAKNIWKKEVSGIWKNRAIEFVNRSGENCHKILHTHLRKI